MKITLQKLIIINFKGIPSLEIDFSNKTNIYGVNGSGKTTVGDAYRWLLTGKDSYDRKDFEIKPTDSSGKTISKTENQVTGVFDVDGHEVVFSRVNREKHQTTKGSSTEKFKGNETKFFYNEVPLSQKDYQAKVAEIFADDMQMKLLTDPTFFNLNLTWQNRRAILTEMAGSITDQGVLDSFRTIKNKPETALIVSVLDSKKTFEERKKELASKKKIAKDEKDLIPSRIDEVNRSKPEQIDFENLKSQVAKLLKEVTAYDEQISNRNAAHEAAAGEIKDKRTRLTKLQSKLSEIESKHTIAYNSEINAQHTESDSLNAKFKEMYAAKGRKSEELSNIELRIENGRKTIDSSNKAIATYTQEKDRLLLTWKDENAKQLVIDESACHCPTCKQTLPEGDAEAKRQEMLQEFAKNKQTKLNSIVANADIIKGKIENENNSIAAYKDGISKLENERKVLSSEIDQQVIDLAKLDIQLSDIKSKNTEKVVQPVTERLMADKEHLKLLNDISVLKNDIATYQPADVSDIISKKSEVQNKINSINLDLAKEDQIIYADQRREELMKQESALAQEIANYEAEEFAIQAFIKFKMQLVEEKINGMFKIVKFRMFREQINGGEDPCCDCLVDGIEYEKNLNTANKINAGIDIINALSRHYNIDTPIFLDNRESVTNILPTENQVINLIVSESDEKLRVEQEIMDVEFEES